MISGKLLFILSGLLIVLVTFCSLWGLLTPDFYSRETLNWQAQSIGQDLIDLVVIVPALILTTVFARLNKKSGFLLWAGVLLYLIYTFTIYCFAVHFNVLFPVYCLVLGLSFYSFLYVVYRVIKRNAMPVLANSWYIKLVGFYFLVISVLFCILWLSDIIASIRSRSVPVTLKDSGLLTNPVHVIDLAIFLPGLFTSGWLVLARKPVGFLFTPILLMFFILMDITIGILVIVMYQRGLEADISVATGMSVLALFSTGILILYSRQAKYES